jgi:hypothetical protein
VIVGGLSVSTLFTLLLLPSLLRIGEAATAMSGAGVAVPQGSYAGPERPA